MKHFAFAIFALLLSPAVALAAPAALGHQVCNIDGPYKSQQASLSATAGYESCGMDMKSAATGVGFIGARLEPMSGFAQLPVFIYSQCYYMANTSNQSYFVPVSTPQELAAFLNSPPAGVVVRACPHNDIYLSQADLCTTGKLVSSLKQSYADGGNSISRLSGLDARLYYVIDAQGQVLRSLRATPLQNGSWNLAYSGACPDAEGKQVAAAPAPLPVAFDRNASANMRTPPVVAAPVAAAPAAAAPVAVTMVPIKTATAPATSGQAVRGFVSAMPTQIAPVAATMATPAAMPVVSRVPITDGALVRHIYN